MTTEKFLQLLHSGGDKELRFAYAPGQLVPTAYHITEVKSAHINSVDCGGKEHAYDETIVQLWLNGIERKKRAMTAAKAAKIFDIVNAKRALRGDTEIFFEYGYGDLATSVYRVTGVAETEDQIVVKMEVPGTACKPMQAITDLLPVAEGCCGGGGCC